MKILAIILTGYILTLAIIPNAGVLPGISATMCCEANCQDDGQPHEEEKHEGCQEMCNVLLSCPCCIGFFPPHHVKLVDDISHRQRDAWLHKPFIVSLYIFPIWHPPRG